MGDNDSRYPHQQHTPLNVYDDSYAGNMIGGYCLNDSNYGQNC